ncbi:MAG: ferrochelatase [Anaerolineales bacterium]|nr:ferrochelatase [Anaerolineales bacterium]MCA9928046.1 ferrochelatase [Anaerolineales bacterium]
MPNFTGQTSYEHGSIARIGVLLVNLGTPEAPTGKALRPYLREFLGDPRVIEYPRWLWWLILNGIILNVRPKKSAKLYASIWTDKGSPLLLYSQSIADKMQAELADTWGDTVKVVPAMRYGNPSIKAALAEMKQANVQRILVLPLFPQYSATTTATIFDIVFDELKKYRWMPELRTITTYHDHPLYIQALANSIRDFWAENGRSQKLLYSFHGIPQSYYDKGDPYACFCQKTARLVSEELGLSEEDYQVCFQSRFGPEEWLQPYTDKTLESWAQAGMNSVDTICPGFAADCLETLEEMAVQNKEIFIDSGGSQYQYIPCLNDSDDQMTLMLALVNTNLRGWEKESTSANQHFSKS